MELKEITEISLKHCTSRKEEANEWFKENNIDCRMSETEAIVLELLTVNDIHGGYLTDIEEQTTNGDIQIEELNIQIFADIKSFTLNKYNKHFKLAVDIYYYKCDELGNLLYENKKPIPHKQGYYQDNLGWIFHLEECDLLILINKKEGVVYIVENFQSLRNEIIKAIDNNYIEKFGNIVDKLDFNSYNNAIKSTKLLWIDLDNEWICNKLGINVKKYKFKLI